MRTACRAAALLLLISVPGWAGERHDLFTEVLKAHVREGWVDYASLKGDTRLGQYCRWLAETDPDALPSDKDKLAFWINAYNAYTLQIVAEKYPIESINDLHGGGLVLGTIFNTTVWDKKLAVIGGRQRSLNWIEHKVIRPRFKDPRAHFALVCASRSCPPLRAEAYEGVRLDAQLDEQGRIFLADPERNSFVAAEKTARLSKIFDWFDDDFGRNDAEILRFVAGFLPVQLKDAILADVRAWRIRHMDYDWGLNDVTQP